MKILWHSVAPWVGTGYGQQTAQATRRIRDLGHDVAISAYYGLMGAKMQWSKMPVYPAYAKPYGVDTVLPHAFHHFTDGDLSGVKFGEVARKGLIITLGDVWTFQAPLLAQANVAAWVPIDHETVPPMVLDWFHATGAAPIAMSRFGERLMQKAGLPVLYVPHAIDTSVYCPGDRAEARARAGLPADAFVVAIVAANIGTDGNRKAFSEQISAFVELHRRHPDTVLALHTDIASPLGVDIHHLLEEMLPRTAWTCTDQYAYRVGMPASAVADIMRAADVLSNTSWGEGFGVPIIEAQACGTPVIVTDTTAMPELVGGGWLVEGEPLWHESQSAWARRPLIGSIVERYLHAYEHARDDDLRARAWEHASKYGADRVAVEHWKPVLEQLEESMQTRAERLAAKSRQPKRPAIREADGLLWLVVPGSGAELGPAAHEAELAPVLDAHLPEGGVLLDVGAHVGHWALRLARRASRVYAVEPHPDAVSTLRRNVALNDLSNIEILPLAAWDEPATLRLDSPNGLPVDGSTRTLPAGDGDGIRVQADRLDDVLEVERLDLVLLDAEGSDLHALRGMADLLRRHRPTLIIEDHSPYGYYTRADLETLLRELGYRWSVAVTYMTTWRPDGQVGEPTPAEHLLAVPVERPC